MNVLQAAKIRIRNVFANGCKIYLSFSSGKDSLCMANLVYEMILSGELDPKQLTVTFIDEEGLYPSMVDAAPASGVSWKQTPNRRIIKPSAKTCCSSTRSGTPSPRTPYPTSTTGEACS